MKKTFLSVLVLVLATGVFAQSERYQKAMQANIAAMDTTRTDAGWLDLSSAFQRIADAEQSQWLPYYYAAYGNVMQGLMLSGGQQGGFADKTDPLADKAETLLNKAETLAGGPNADIYCVRKMIANLRMLADPMTRWQSQGPLGAEALAKAKALEAGNPRITILEAQDKFYTPEQFGGSKTEAKALFEEALKQFETYKPASALHPNWGKNQVYYFLSQLK